VFGILAVRMVADVTETRNVIPSWNSKLEEKSLKLQNFT